VGRDPVVSRQRRKMRVEDLGESSFSSTCFHNSGERICVSKSEFLRSVQAGLLSGHLAIYPAETSKSDCPRAL
jgi:hypothetical protein